MENTDSRYILSLECYFPGLSQVEGELLSLECSTTVETEQQFIEGYKNGSCQVTGNSSIQDSNLFGIVNL